MNWLESKEEKSAVITSVSTLIVAFLGFLGGFFTSKSDLLELAKFHETELIHQKQLLISEYEKKILLEELNGWHQQAKQLLAARNSIDPIDENMKSTVNLKHKINNLIDIEKSFDSIAFARFIEDHANQKVQNNFDEFSREKAQAFANLQVYVLSLPNDLSNLNASQYHTFQRELINFLNKDAECAAKYYGLITYLTPKQIAF